MKCPKCGFPDQTRVIDTTPTSYGIYRRRKCLKCEKNFSSLEFAVPENKSKDELIQIIDKLILKGK